MGPFRYSMYGPQEGIDGKIADFMIKGRREGTCYRGSIEVGTGAHYDLKLASFGASFLLLAFLKAIVFLRLPVSREMEKWFASKFLALPLVNICIRYFAPLAQTNNVF